MKKYWWVILIICIFLLFGLLYCALVGYLIAQPSDFSTFGRGGVALIRIEGVISASGEGAFNGGANPENIISQLRRAEKDSRVKAILLRINSPGGTAAASQEIFYELKKVKKPVVVSISDMGASGAYWVACASDYIYASPASDVGSIGVIIAIPNLRGLFEKLGIEYIVITQGKFKDIGNPGREMTSEEKKILRDQAEVIYNIFIKDVAESRKLSEKKVRELATGLAYPGIEAEEKGLIDELGSYNDAINKAADLGKIKGEPQIIVYKQPNIFDVLGGIFESKSLGLDELDLLRNLNQYQQEDRIIKK